MVPSRAVSHTFGILPFPMDCDSWFRYACLSCVALVGSMMQTDEILQLRANDVLVIPTSVSVALGLRTLFFLEACMTPLSSIVLKWPLHSYRVVQALALVLALAALVGQVIINWNSFLLSPSFDDKFCESRLRCVCAANDSPPIASSLRRPRAPGLVLSPQSDAIASTQVTLNKTQLECKGLLLLLDSEMPNLGTWEAIVKSVKSTNETDTWCKQYVRNETDASFAVDNVPSTVFGPEIKSLCQSAKWMSIILVAVMVTRSILLYQAVTAFTESPVTIIEWLPEERKMELRV